MIKKSAIPHLSHICMYGVNKALLLLLLLLACLFVFYQAKILYVYNSLKAHGDIYCLEHSRTCFSWTL